MRAVNLIPMEERRGGGAPTRSGGLVYVALGILAVLVVMLAGTTLAGRSIDNARADLERVTAEAEAAERTANALAPYRRFAELRERRATTVRDLAATRFDWASALHEVGRVVPGSVRLTSIVGTVAPGVTVDGANSGATGAVRSALAVPAVELVGCTGSQADVARFLARLRTVRGVTRVALAQSEKENAVAGGAGGGGEDCRNGSSQRPKFEAVAFFGRSTAQAAGATK